jgi:hypothetical protein
MVCGGNCLPLNTAVINTPVEFKITSLAQVILIHISTLLGLGMQAAAVKVVFALFVGAAVSREVSADTLDPAEAFPSSLLDPPHADANTMTPSTAQCIFI